MTASKIKEQMRKDLLARRGRLGFEEVYGLSLRIQRRFVATEEFRSAKKLALYSSFRNEVLTDEIFLRALEEKKEVYFPRVIKEGPHLAFYRVNGKEELSPGSYNILEPPRGGFESLMEEFDCAIVPGVAFDAMGGRLGYGRGYYDRILVRAKCPTVALAFSFQILSEPLPSEVHDVRVDSIVTEKRVFRI